MMSKARYESILAGMTQSAQKVFAATPKREAWTLLQIANEIYRLRAGLNLNPSIVGGCLNTLAKSGLVKEVEAGKFCRAQYREPKQETVIILGSLEKEKTQMTTIAVNKPAPVKPAAATQSPIDKLGALAARLTELSKAIKETAAAIGDAAVEAQIQMETSASDAEKLKQLQALLKGMV